MRIRQVVLYGIISAAITGAVGWFGMSLTDNGGFISLLGWVLGIGGYAFAGMALWHVVRTVSLHRKGMKMMRDDPAGFAALANQFEEANKRLEQSDGEFSIVPEERFIAQTMGGRPTRMNTTIYDGHPFDCACGETHTFTTAGVPILRELPGMKLVMACPNGDALTCVKVTGGPFKFKGFKSLLGTAINAGAV
jgi:hypothetical protein